MGIRVEVSFELDIGMEGHGGAIRICLKIREMSYLLLSKGSLSGEVTIQVGSKMVCYCLIDYELLSPDSCDDGPRFVGVGVVADYLG